MNHDVGLMLDFMTYVNRLPAWIKSAVQVYAAGGSSVHTICVDVDDIDDLKAIKKKLSYYGLKVEFIRQHERIYNDDRDGKPYSHFSMCFKGAK